MPSTRNKPFKLFFRKKQATTNITHKKHRAFSDTATVDTNFVRNLENELDTIFNSYFSSIRAEDDESLDTLDVCSLDESECGSYDKSECGSYDDLSYEDDENQCMVCTDFHQLFCEEG